MIFHTVENVQNPLCQNDLIIFQVQSAALAAMKDEMLELASRLTRVTKERDYMEKALNRLQVSFLSHYTCLFVTKLRIMLHLFNAKLFSQDPILHG